MGGEVTVSNPCTKNRKQGATLGIELSVSSAVPLSTLKVNHVKPINFIQSRNRKR